MINPPIHTALCAYGMSGSVFHAPLLDAHPGFYMKKILQRTPRGAKERYPYIDIVKDVKDILTDPKIELVVVNTPEHTHYELTKKALEAGKHVVVEKAFTPTYSEAEELVTLAQKLGRMLVVFQNRRWDGDFLTVSKVVKENMLGRLVSFESHFDRYRNYIQEGSWKEDEGPGRGVLYNLGTHLIDQALVLFGKPASVTADVRIQRQDGAVPDAFDIWLNYPEVKVKLSSSYLVRKPGPRFMLHGTLGSFEKYGFDPQEDALKQGAVPTGANWGNELAENWGNLITDLTGLTVRGQIETLPGVYEAFYTGVYECLRHGAPKPVSDEDMLSVIRIVEAAIESSKKGIAIAV